MPRMIPGYASSSGVNSNVQVPFLVALYYDVNDIYNRRADVLTKQCAGLESNPSMPPNPNSNPIKSESGYPAIPTQPSSQPQASSCPSRICSVGVFVSRTDRIPSHRDIFQHRIPRCVCHRRETCPGIQSRIFPLVAHHEPITITCVAHVSRCAKVIRRKALARSNKSLETSVRAQRRPCHLRGRPVWDVVLDWLTRRVRRS